jgi:vacuolar-type H+-ATPase subunit I/STV1
MAYKKRDKSPEVTKASNRLKKIETVESNFDLGNGHTKAAYEAKIKAVEDQTKIYNAQLAQVDAELITLDSLERELANLSDLMLKGVGMKYRFDSLEYEKAGGTRKGGKRKSTSTASKDETPTEE